VTRTAPPGGATASSRRLLRVLIAACAAVFALACWVFVAKSSDLLGDRLHAYEERSLADYAVSHVRPIVVSGGRLTVGATAERRLKQTVVGDSALRSIQVWDRRGRLVHSTNRSDRSQTRLLVTEGLLAALFEGDRKLEEIGGTHAVAVPLYRGGTLIGALVLRSDAEAATSLVAETRWAIGALAAVTLFVALVGVAVVVGIVGHRLVAQGAELDESQHEVFASYKELEEGSREAMETLNATVEAKDPYTAGHSERVRRVSLAIGRQLHLSPKRLGALSTAALFHDVGKIGVPDEILTKSGDLTPVEFELLTRHAAQGADIVGNLSRLQEAVPLVRHHHERWDGRGYPDRLSGTTIPVESAIIAVADAWDAMTTSRPYRRALPVQHALSQIEAGRGTQFSPAVVDAFLAFARDHLHEIAPPADVPVLAVAG
jgi:HD-GYP domain-containing protein (c-di-GMP phosphodiesterase class II)